MQILRRNLSPTTWVLSVAALAIGCGYLSTSLELSWWLVGFNALLLVFAMLERRRTAGAIDVFEPIVIFVLSWGLFFVARPIAMLVDDDFSLGPLDARPGFNGALVMAAVGTLGFAVGYIGRFGILAARRFRPNEVEPERTMLISAATACALAGVLLFFAFLSRGGGIASIGTLLGGRSAAQGEFYRGAPAYVFYGVFFCFPAALVFYWQSLRDGSRTLRLFALVASIPPVVFSFSTGIRSWLLPMLLSYAIVHYSSRRRRPSGVSLVLAGLVVFFLGIVFVGTFRNADTRQAVGPRELLVDTVSHPGESVLSVLQGGDSEMVALLAIINEKVPNELPFRFGTATGELFVHYVPRQVWKSKPRAGDEVFTQEVLANPYFAQAPRQYTPLANFYLDFGYFGVLVGMMMLGMLARFHFEALGRNQSGAARQLLFAATLPLWIPLLRGSLTDTAGRLFFVLPPLLMIFFVSTRYASRHEPERTRRGVHQGVPT
jgi:hypothetical protein